MFDVHAYILYCYAVPRLAGAELVAFLVRRQRGERGVAANRPAVDDSVSVWR